MSLLHRTGAISLSIAFVSSVIVAISASPAEAAITPTKIWRQTYSKQFIESSPNVVNLDGQLDIVVGNYDGKMYAVHPDGSTVAGWPFNTGNGIDSSPSAADVNGDGQNEVFFGSGRKDVHNGDEWSVASNGQLRWRFHPSDPVDPNVSVFTTPAIADVTGDGQPDVSAFTLGLHGWSLNASSGAINPGWHIYQDDSDFSSPAFADVDGDGIPDYIFGGDSEAGGVVDHRGGVLRAVRGDGSVIWQVFTDEVIRSSPSVGDVDGDGVPEIVVGAGDFWANNIGGTHDSSRIFTFDLQGHLKWSGDLGAHTLASPTLADVNDDGRLDIIEGTWNGSNPGRVYVVDGLTHAALPNWNGKASGGGVVIGQITTADLDGDGGQDLLVPTGAGVFAYSGKTGASLFSLDVGEVSFQSSPWVGDLDADSKLDIVVAGGTGAPDVGGGILERWELPSTTGHLGTLSWPQFRKDTRHTGTWLSIPLSFDRCAINPGHSYVMASSDGGIYGYCITWHGSMGGSRLVAPVVGVARRPSGDGYWEVASDGGIFDFGAGFHGSKGGQPLNKPIVGMASTATGNGYWLVASDGGIFTYGDAGFLGSKGGQPLNQPIVGMAATPSGNGYWLVASDGGIFTYGDAGFYGSKGGQPLNKPIVGMAPTPSGQGYWLVASDGGIFTYGDAEFYGSTGSIRLVQPVVGMQASPDGHGYRMVAADGGVFTYGTAAYLGSAAAVRKGGPVIGVA